MRAGKSPAQRLCSDVLCSEVFIRTLGVPAFGRLLATLMGFNWRAIDDNGGYPLTAPHPDDAAGAGAAGAGAAAEDDEREEEEGTNLGGRGGGGIGGRGGNRRVVPVQRRRLDSGVLRRLMAKNKLDPFVWTVAFWRDFDVTAQLPAVTVRHTFLACTSSRPHPLFFFFFFGCTSTLISAALRDALLVRHLRPRRRVMSALMKSWHKKA